MIPFATQIEQECVVGSAIAPELFTAAIRVVPDLAVSVSGDLETPIDDALNRQLYKRFRKQAQASQSAALFLNESGEVWQAKLEVPRLDRQKNKPIKYETPLGNGCCAYLPPIPSSIRDRIATRHQVDVPQDESFWTWLETRPEIPIIWTEGAKKALSLLSQGYVAISLYGVHGGYRAPQKENAHRLIQDVDRFCQSGRVHVLAFDQDEKPKTQKTVRKALWRFGTLLEATQGRVSVMTWSGAKGIDDFIVTAGINALEVAYANAQTFHYWNLERTLFRSLKCPVSLTAHAPDLSTLTLDQLPQEGILAFISPKGAEKT